jgi:hypothetical protein
VVQAYRRGLERRLAGGLSLDLTSFASVFMSRYDAPVDDVHIGRIRASSSPEEIATLKSVVGRVSIANAWMVVRRFREFFDGPDFAPLSAAGARTQRPLWPVSWPATVGMAMSPTWGCSPSRVRPSRLLIRRSTAPDPWDPTAGRGRRDCRYRLRDLQGDGD